MSVAEACARLDRVARAMPVGRDGLNDIWRLYRDPSLTDLVVSLLVRPFRDCGITAVVGAESRGLLIGGMVALRLGCAFVPARKTGRYLPGEVLQSISEPDWEGKRVTFAMQRHALSEGDQVLLVDDWYTTGNQARAVIELIKGTGAEVRAISAIVEEGTDNLGSVGVTYHALLRWSEEIQEFSISPCNVIAGDGVSAKNFA
jgi:adenine phosphoribosyltransferase